MEHTTRKLFGILPFITGAMGAQAAPETGSDRVSTVNPRYDLVKIRPGNFQPRVTAMALRPDGKLVVCVNTVGALAAAGVLLLAAAPRAQDIVATDTAQAGPDFPFQGEYFGEAAGPDGGKYILSAQVVARGNGSFRAVFHNGGFPGAPGFSAASRLQVNGSKSGDKVALSGSGFTASLTPEAITGNGPNGTKVTLHKVRRASPTLGLKAPTGAKVLFDGSNVSAFRSGATIDARGLLAVPATTSATYGSYSMHLEFQLAFMPSATGQARSNSGIIMNTGGYAEVQVLDSFGDVPYSDGCGGLYGAAAPLFHANLPPLTWQTYDINFTAPATTGDAFITVRHNGVIVQNRTVLKNRRSATTIEFQDHDNPVFYRNIWIVSRDDFNFGDISSITIMPRERLSGRQGFLPPLAGSKYGGAAVPGLHVHWGGGYRNLLGRQAVTASLEPAPAVPIPPDAQSR